MRLPLLWLAAPDRPPPASTITVPTALVTGPATPPVTPDLGTGDANPAADLPPDGGAALLAWVRYADAPDTEPGLAVRRLRLLTERRSRLLPSGSAGLDAATARRFDDGRDLALALLPAPYAPLGHALGALSLPDLAVATATAPPLPDDEAVSAWLGALAHTWAINPHLAAVDAVAPPGSPLRDVQPATVRLRLGASLGSGVNLAPEGLILTAGHVVERVGAEVLAELPDGLTFRGVVTALDPRVDLALVALADVAGLAVARLAPAPPQVGAPIVVIGQAGDRSGFVVDDGRFTVTRGHIRGLGDTTGPWSTTHDALTAYGNSGSPLFDVNGGIVAVHDAWDSGTGLGRAVSWEEITRFLATNHPAPTPG